MDDVGRIIVTEPARWRAVRVRDVDLPVRRVAGVPSVGTYRMPGAAYHLLGDADDWVVSGDGHRAAIVEGSYRVVGLTGQEEPGNVIDHVDAHLIPVLDVDFVPCRGIPIHAT